mgnify:CR=1 FL=1
MSSDLLQQAMIDAAALKEAAMKNAENALIEKYSAEFNQTVQKLLEQEDPAVAAPADAAAMPPPADPNAAPQPPEQAEDEDMISGMQKGSHNVDEYVKSLYDRNTGRFPRGETGVLSSVGKKFGDSAVPVAQSVIENLKQSFDDNIMRMRKLAGVS